MCACPPESASNQHYRTSVHLLPAHRASNPKLPANRASNHHYRTSQQTAAEAALRKKLEKVRREQIKLGIVVNHTEPQKTKPRTKDKHRKGYMVIARRVDVR